MTWRPRDHAKVPRSSSGYGSVATLAPTSIMAVSDLFNIRKQVLHKFQSTFLVQRPPTAGFLWSVPHQPHQCPHPYPLRPPDHVVRTMSATPGLMKYLILIIGRPKYYHMIGRGQPSYPKFNTVSMTISNSKLPTEPCKCCYGLRTTLCLNHLQL
jgi:hypothetical protein